MQLTFAHYRNRFCMFRTYYALATGKLVPDGFTIRVVELPDPPSHEQEEALIRGDVQVANLYLINFLRRKLERAPIVGLSTEWKSTMKGNGLFVRAGGPIEQPRDLAGCLIATHQGSHAIHRYLLRHAYGVDDHTLRWAARPQESLLDELRSGNVDAVVLLDHFFFQGEMAAGVRCLYTDGEAWKKLRGFDQMVKHVVAAREDLLRDHPQLKDRLLQAFRDSFAYSEGHLEEIGDAFVKLYGGAKEALLASARYPKIEFTFTEQEQRLVNAEMDMLVEVGEIPHKAAVSALFAI